MGPPIPPKSNATALAALTLDISLYRCDADRLLIAPVGATVSARARLPLRPSSNGQQQKTLSSTPAVALEIGTGGRITGPQRK